MHWKGGAGGGIHSTPHPTPLRNVFFFCKTEEEMCASVMEVDKSAAKKPREKSESVNERVRLGMRGTFLKLRR